jgi:ADP-ribosylglycohydrolase/heme-degrading monooxygenase HmoA
MLTPGNLADLLTSCAYTARYRPTTLATDGSLPPDHLAIVTISATEHRPGQRRPFFEDTHKVLADLPSQPGLLGHAFRFELIGNKAWTITAWRDQASQDAFVHSPAHRTAVRRSPETTQNTRFVTLRRPLSSLPLRWPEILALLSSAPPVSMTNQSRKPNANCAGIAPEKTNTMKNILLTSLIADALSLGSHWIYSQQEIADKFGDITGYSDPATSYHTGKHAGDFTHYGDQTMVLLRSLASHGRFDLDAFASEWRTFWENHQTQSYRDGATKATLENLRSGLPPADAASPSNDFAGAARIAPLFLLQWKSSDDLIAAARAQTSFTHSDPSVVDAAEFFARTSLAVQQGVAIPDALRAAVSNTLQKNWLEAALASSTSATSDSAATKTHGLTCHTPEAFPSVCHLLLRHPDDGTAALTANVAAGGDNAARGMIIGMVHGAKPDATPLPEHWLTGLRAYSEIKELIETIHSHA